LFWILETNEENGGLFFLPLTAQVHAKMETISLESLGKVIAKRRASLRISQAELAESSDLHRSYVSDIENGGRNISVSVLMRIAKSLQTDINSIVRAAERLHRLESSDNEA
jgi:transcriptional regulator with XRE-family HTH domain